MQSSFIDQLPLLQLEDYLRHWYNGQFIDQPQLKESILESLLNGGKRFRAVLVFTSTKILGRPLHDAFPLAGAIEMIHAYSLVHDDLPAMDDAEYRRGRATIHRQFGEDMAILAGDALLTDAFQLLSQADANPKELVALIQQLAQAAGSVGMVSGQAADLREMSGQIDFEKIQSIHARKTGRLIEWSLCAPFWLWEPQHPNLEAIQIYAKQLGVLYQLRDDLLDSDPEANTGKDSFLDEGKNTFASMEFASMATQHLELEMSKCLEPLIQLPEAAQILLQTIAEWVILRKS